MRKLLVGILLAACATLALAATTKYNPHTGNLDFLGSGSSGGGSLSILSGGSFVSVSSIAPAGLAQFTVVSGTGIITVDTSAIISLIATSTADKATVNFVNTSTSDKATITFVNTSTSDKATINFVNTSTADKATVNFVNTSTSDKATVSFVNTSTGNKATTTSVQQVANSTGIWVNGGVKVTSITFTGAGVATALAGDTITVTIAGSAGGGGDNLGTHVASKTIDVNGFGIAGASNTRSNFVSISTPFADGLLTLSTTADTAKPLVWVGVGAGKVLEVDKSSMIVAVPTTFVGGLAGDVITATGGVTAASITLTGTGQNFVIQSTSSVNNTIIGAGASSMTVTNSSVSFNATSGIALNGLGIFYSTATGINLDAYRIQAGTGTVAANTTLTVTPAGCTTVNLPIIAQADGNATIGLELNSQVYNAANFVVKNTDAVNPHPFNWWVFCK